MLEYIPSMTMQLLAEYTMNIGDRSNVKSKRPTKAALQCVLRSSFSRAVVAAAEFVLEDPKRRYSVSMLDVPCVGSSLEDSLWDGMSD